jgi:hypothetical protein
MGEIELSGCVTACCVTGIGLLELTGFGLSLEQPTVTEQTISTAAKTSALVFLPQVMERVSAMVRNALMRVMFGHLLPASGILGNARQAPRMGALISRGLEKGALKQAVGRGTRCG